MRWYLFLRERLEDGQVREHAIPLDGPINLLNCFQFNIREVQEDEHNRVIKETSKVYKLPKQRRQAEPPQQLSAASRVMNAASIVMRRADYQKNYQKALKKHLKMPKSGDIS